MAKTKTAAQVEVKLQNIDILNTSLDPLQTKFEREQKFVFNVEINHRFELDKRMAFVAVRVRVKLEGDEKVLGSVGLLLRFEAELGKIAKSENGKILFPSDFIRTLNEMSLHTTRGAMFMIFKGTPLHNALLPLIPANQLTNEAAKSASY